MKRTRRVAVFAVPFYLFAAAAIAADLPIFVAPGEGDFSLARAERLALEAEPALQAATLRLEAMREEATTADSLAAPNLMLRAANLPVDTFELSQEPMTQAVVGVSQAFPAGDTRVLRKQKAERRTSEAEATLALQRANLLRQLRLAWLDVWMGREAVSLLDEQRAVLRRLQPTVERAYAAGRASQMMVEKIRLRLARLQERRARELGATEAARQRLTRWFAPPQVGLWPRSLPPRLQQIPAGEVGAHPQIVVAQAATAVSEVEAALAEQAYKSRWVADASYGWRDGRPDFVSLGVKVSLPSLVAARNDSKVAAARAQLRASARTVAATQASLSSEAARLRAEVEALDARIAAYDEDILPSLRRLNELAESEYRAGKGSASSILEVAEDLVEAQSKRLDLYRQRSKNIVQLWWLLEDAS